MADPTSTIEVDLTPVNYQVTITPAPDLDVQIQPYVYNLQFQAAGMGPPGPPGPTGTPGAPGSPGSVGPPGQAGPAGAAATINVGSTVTGAPGSNATVTNSGSQSAAVFNFQIPAGVTGATGSQGATGATGPQGNPGPPLTPKGTVASSPNLPTTGQQVGDLWTTNDTGHGWSWNGSQWIDLGVWRGATGATGPQGNPGATGSQGPQGNPGAAGAAATIAAGTATGLPAGSNPTVSNSGSSSAAVFNFGIPAGQTGATGAAGATGPAGPTAISANANNKATLGSDSLTLVQGTAAGVAATTHAQTVSGDDPQLTNARTPTAHASTHAKGGSDFLAIAPSANAGNLLSSGTDSLLYLPQSAIISSWRKHNAIRNPEMLTIQRGSSGTFGGYTLDGWQLGWNGTMAPSWSQIAANIPADASGNYLYPFIPYAYRVTISTAQASLAAGNYLTLTQPIEGALCDPLQGNNFTIWLLVRSSIAGTLAVSISDYTGVRSYVVNVTIPTANVWQLVQIPNIPAWASVGGFTNYGSAGCAIFSICLGTGTTYQTTPSAWQTGNFKGTSSTTNWSATAGTTFDFTIPVMEPNTICTPYVRRGVQEESLLNQRYFTWFQAVFLGWIGQTNWTQTMGLLTFPSMRAAPSLGASPAASFAVSSGNAGTPQIGASNLNFVNLNNSANNWTVGTTNWAQFTGGLSAEL